MMKTIFLCGLGLLLCGSLSAAEPAAASTETVKGQAVKLLDQGKAQEAYDLLKAKHDADKSDVETSFMLAQAAMALKRPAEAAALYEEILAKNPALPRVRLELGRAYAAAGELTKAAEQFQAVLAGSPPPTVGENIGKYMASMQTEKNWNGRFGLGYIYDTNVNAGPTASSVLMFGLPFTLSNDARETDGAGYTFNASGGYFKKLKGDLAAQADLQYSRTAYSHLSGFDSDVISGSAGLTLQKKSYIVSLPLLLESVYIGHARYDHAFGLSPQAQVPLTERLSANAAFVIQKKHYYVNDGLRDGTVWSAAAGAKYFYRQDGFLQATLRHGVEGTGAKYTDNSSNSLNLGWYAGLPRGFSLYAGPGLSYTAYEAKEAAYDEKRKDTQYSAVFNLSKEFDASGYSATLGYSFTRNDSNLALYDYNRGQLTLQVSKAF
jgi:tetratricopeptide (TPR) repeat protein